MISSKSIHKSFVSWKLISLTFSLFLFFSFILIPTVVQCASEKKTQRFSFKGFELTVQKKVGEDYIYEYKISYSRNILSSGESMDQNPFEYEIRPDTPRKDCKSLLIPTYTGGAHCCSINILCIVCGAKKYFAILELKHSEMEFVDQDRDGTKEILLTDWSFAYYGLSDDVFLSFAESPGLKRLLVFTPQGWRADRPGEFPSMYQRLVKGIPREKSATGAIALSYYALMAGKGEAAAEALLVKYLPDPWKPKRSKTFSDIKRSVKNFKPFKNRIFK